MLGRARQEFLLQQIELHGTVRSSEAAEELGVTQVTIRRDISALEVAGLVHRVHGGAVAAKRGSHNPRPARTLIGVVVPSSTVYYPDIITGMESVAAELGIRMVLGISHYRPETERVQVERLLALGVRGLVLTPTLDEPDPSEDVAAWLESIPVPVVVLERSVRSSRAVRELDSMRTDHRHGGLLAVDHFSRLGHRSVLLAIGATPTAPAVTVGYHEAVEQLGLDSVPVVALSGDPNEPGSLTNAIEEFVTTYRERGTIAVLAHPDHLAIQMVEVAQLGGLSIPEDLAIISYDDIVAEHAAVPLTAIAPPRRELGREALRLIDRRLRAGAEQTAPRHAKLLPRLIVRESCGAPSSSR